MRSLKRKEPELAVPGRYLTDPGHPHVRFGQYRDLTLQQIVRRDKEYCRWVLSQSVFEVDPHSGVKISFDCATSGRREIYYGVDSFQSLHGNASAFHS